MNRYLDESKLQEYTTKLVEKLKSIFPVKTGVNNLVTGMMAAGETKSVASSTTVSDLLTNGVTLEKGHRYLLTYMVQWGANSNGRRWSEVWIDNTGVGIISADHRMAMPSGVATCRGVIWIQPSNVGDRTLMIKGWQDSGSTISTVIRYQLIDYGTVNN